MFKAFSKAISQLNDRRTRKVLWLCIGTAMVVFTVLWVGIGFLLTSTVFFATGWLETAVDLLGGLATLILTWFLFPGIMSALIGLFLEDIAGAVEARHYPSLPKAKGLPATAAVLTTLRFLGVVIILNISLLIFLLFPPVFPFVFYAVNGYLLSREYFELVALRRIGPEEMRSLRRAHRGRLFMAGVVITLLLTVPLVNLLAPIVATAAMVHLFEGWREKS
ncbi:MAG: EI24 domain-containing protein [Rhodospirillales bacterium]